MAPRGSQQYVPPPIPANESERLEDLYALRVLDTAAEERFDRYTNLIADLFEFPIVLVSLIDHSRQWFKSACGLYDRQWPREISFCGHAILQNGIFIVKDARKDPRFKENPAVKGEPHIIFYAGASVHGPTGKPVGSLCVVDHKPREFSDRQCRQLKHFAVLVERELHHSYVLADLRSSVEFKAFYDPLTGLPNKRLIRDRLETLTRDREREGGNLVVAIFNLKGLRYINQAFGSSAGDELLKEVGSRLESAMPVGTQSARLGGDEFVVVLPAGDADMAHCEAVLQPVRDALEQPYHIGGMEHFVHFSVGISIYPMHGRAADALLEKAASAIRTRDARRLDTTHTYNQSHALKISKRLHLENRLRRALSEENFRMVYQPIADMASNQMFSVEALLRWDDPEVDDTSPSGFIQVAEDTGLIVPIGEWIVGEVCRQLAQWRRFRTGWAVPVTLNVSAVQLQRHGFARAVFDELETHELAPALLHVEVTEFSLVLDTLAVRENLGTFNEAGVYILIDDFGTGYCSLQYLRRMPVWALKIDQTFIAGLPDAAHDVAITDTVLAMAQNLGFKTVAEGIERAEQLRLLQQKGCDYAQGYFFCRPTEPGNIPALTDRALPAPAET